MKNPDYRSFPSSLYKYLFVLTWILIGVGHATQGQTVQVIYGSVNSVSFNNTKFAKAGMVNTGIQASTLVTFTKSSVFVGQSKTAEFRVGFQLVDSAGGLVTLETPTGTATTIYDDDWEGNSDAGFPITLSSLQNSRQETFSATLTPVSQLNPAESYKVRAIVYYWGQVKLRWTWLSDDTLDSSGGYFLQFTGAASPDTAMNVISVLDAVSIPDRTALAGSSSTAAAHAFQVQTMTTLNRWDNWTSSRSQSVIEIVYDVEFWRRDTVNGDEQVPLVDSRFIFHASMYNYNQVSIFKSPASDTFFHTFGIVPDGVQLDSVNEMYYAKVQVSHVEVITKVKQLWIGNQRSSPSVRVMHFNGDLSFGSTLTQLEDFTNDAADSGIWSSSYIQTTIDNAEGHISGNSGYTWGPASVTLLLYPDGSAVVASPTSSIPVTQPTLPDGDAASGVRFFRSNLSISRSKGLIGDMLTYLPTGMMWTADPQGNRASGTLPFPGTFFDQSLKPVDPTYTFNAGATIYVTEESKPVIFGGNSIKWTVATGDFAVNTTGASGYVRGDELNALEATPLPNALRFKRSNEQYYRSAGSVASMEVATGQSGEALMSADFALNVWGLRTHFPYDVVLVWSAGNMVISDDLINPAGSWIDLTKSLVIGYNQSCVSDDCGVGGTLQNMEMIIPDNRLTFTRDGGLVGVGEIDITNYPDYLNWGYISSISDFHHTTTKLNGVNFHMPGHFLRGDQNTGPGIAQAPAVILYSGHLASDPTVIERPGMAGYLTGLTDYAGFNYRTWSDSEVHSNSFIGGQNVLFDLTGRSKYYIRRAGVTGIHEAVPGTFPQEFELYNYRFGFAQYGLSYQSNSPYQSRTEGEVVLGYPSDIVQGFEEMLFTCLGGLDQAKVAGGGSHTLRYWLANLNIHTIDFESENACDPTSETFFLAGVSAEAAYIDAPLYGVLGFLPSGELMNVTSSSINEDSRLHLPALVRFDGPTKLTDLDNPTASSTEVYQLVPSTLAYYNDFAEAPDKGEGAGKINFAGTLDVSFFEDLQVHMQTSARNVLPTQSVPIYLMGGWSDSGNNTFFNSVAFDQNNVGFPAGVDDDLYRNLPGATGDPSDYLVHARQSWLGVVNFDYPLDWSTSTRSFISHAPIKDDLVVLSTEHKVDYLSAESAELTVGITYEGMPEINLSNFVINQVDENTGVFQALLEEAKKPVVDSIEKGIDEIGGLLDDQMQSVYADFFADQIETHVIGPIFADLQALAQTGNYTAAQIHTAIGQRLSGSQNTLTDLIADLADTSGDVSYMFNRIDGSLAEVENGINAIIEGVWVDASGNIIPKPTVGVPDFSGFLTKSNGQFQILAPFIEQLLAQLAPDISAELNTLLSGAVDDLNSRINALLEEAEPTLDQIIVVLTDLRNLVSEIRATVSSGGQMISEFNMILADATTEINLMASIIHSELDAFFASIPDGEAYLTYAEDEISTRLRQVIEDQFFATNFVSQIQVTLKQYLYDVDAAINAAISEAFAQVNLVIRDLVSDSLAEVDESINGFLGDIDEVIGAGQLDGYAQFNGDALRRLHIDLYLQLMVPDELEFNGYLTIEQLDSEGQSSVCTGVAPGDAVTEVTLGAIDVPADWLSPDLRITVGAKFNFQTDPGFKLLGMGGSLEMTKGEINYETFTIKEMGAAMMFGASENYLAAKLGLAFNSYEAYGGVYFGRTCSLDPLLLIDEDVAKILGEPNPTFTGIYMYGECHIPISEALLGIPASCMFRISAGIGSGVFYFVEDNTLGGKIYASVSGEALCVVGIKGEVNMIGVMTGGDLRFRGSGRISGKAGACPFCVKFGKTATITYQGGNWDVDI